MAIPSDSLPQWATGGAVTEPGSGKKATGWVPGELPPAPYFNWLALTTYRWLSYLKNVATGTEGIWALSNAVTSANEAALKVTTSPEDHGGANTWKPILEAFAGSIRSVRLYTGKLSQSQVWLIATNAFWNTATQQWNQSNGTIPSSALLWSDVEGITLAQKPSGSSPWVTWTVGSTMSVAAGSVIANDLNLFDDLVVGDDAHILGDTTLDGDLDVAGVLEVTGTLRLAGSANFTYDSPRTITHYVDVRAGEWDGNYSYSGGAGSFAGNSSSLVTVDISLEPYIPRGATITRVRAMVETTGGFVRLGVFRQTNGFGGSPPSTPVAMLSGGGGYVSSAGPGNQTITYTPNQNQSVSGQSTAFISLGLENEDAFLFPTIELQFTAVNPMIVE